MTARAFVRILAAAMVLALAAGVTACRGRNRGCGEASGAPGLGGDGRYPLFEFLALDKSQRLVLIDARKEHVEVVRPILEELRDLRQQLRVELAKEAPDAGAVGNKVIAIHGLADGLESARGVLEKTLAGILSDEQRRKHQAIESASSWHGRSQAGGAIVRWLRDAEAPDG